MIKKIILTPSILALFWVLHHNLRKNHASDKKTISAYLERENAANSTRRKDLSNLSYITVPFDMLPLDITLNDEKKQLKINEYKKEILNLSSERMLNLIGISNTELKEMYGPANLELLTVYDQNYSYYIRTLQLFSECIYKEYPEKAAAIMEYCINIGTDISSTYELLGHYYLEHNDKEHFLALYDQIPQKDSISGKVIMNKLDQLIKSF